jgi:hypothetical protein
VPRADPGLGRKLPDARLSAEAQLPLGVASTSVVELKVVSTDALTRRVMTEFKIVTQHALGVSFGDPGRTLRAVLAPSLAHSFRRGEKPSSMPQRAAPPRSSGHVRSWRPAPAKVRRPGHRFSLVAGRSELATAAFFPLALLRANAAGPRNVCCPPYLCAQCSRPCPHPRRFLPDRRKRCRFDGRCWAAGGWCRRTCWSSSDYLGFRAPEEHCGGAWSRGERGAWIVEDACPRAPQRPLSAPRPSTSSPGRASSSECPTGGLLLARRGCTLPEPRAGPAPVRGVVGPDAFPGLAGAGAEFRDRQGGQRTWLRAVSSTPNAAEARILRRTGPHERRESPPPPAPPPSTGRNSPSTPAGGTPRFLAGPPAPIALVAETSPA